MYRGFFLLCPAGGTPQFRLIRIDGRRREHTSLVTLAQDPASRTIAALLGRFYYREDLLIRLPEPRGLYDSSDAVLALATYRQLGRRGLETIEGEFALVIWDGERKRLFAQRDPMGCWPLFWAAPHSAVALSTSLGTLVDEQPSRAFNLDGAGGIRHAANARGRIAI